MRRFFRSKFFILFLVLALAVSASALYAVFSGNTSPVKNAVSVMLTPVQRFFTSTGNWTAGIYNRFAGYEKLEMENAALRRELAELRTNMRETDEVMAENEILRQKLGMQARHVDYTIEVAEIIAVSTGSWDTAYTLDRGENSGVAVGNCVIVDEGMAGFITAVGPTWCEMSLVTDMDMSAGAIVSRTRDAGVARGSFELSKSGLLRLVYLPKVNDVKPGDTVVTSGLGGVYPKGILIGTVVEVGIEEHGLASYAIIKPAVDITSLGRVFIITDFGAAE